MLAGCGGGAAKPESQEHKAVRQAAQSWAEMQCQRVSTDQLDRCIRDQAAAFVHDWERRNPGQ